VSGNERKSTRVFRATSALPSGEAPPYLELVNFQRAKSKESIICVMCGSSPAARGAVIPAQNKDVCQDCDTAMWLHNETQVFFKFCKVRGRGTITCFHDVV
jgi:hypothetical protein